MAMRPFESRIQDLVYNVDVGIGLTIIKACLYALFILVIMALFTVSQFKGLRDAESMDYGQLGRNIAAGKGFTTQCVRPVSLWYMIDHSSSHQPQIDHHPDIIHPPVYPYLLSLGFKLTGAPFAAERGMRVFPPEQWVVVPLGLLSSLLSGIFVYLLGRRLFDRRVGFLGMTLYFLSRTVWTDAVSGLNISLMILFCLATSYFALCAAGCSVTDDEDYLAERSFGMALVFVVLSGIFCGLAILTRYGAVIIMPVVLMGLLMSSAKKKCWLALIFILVAVLCVMPWLYRNYSVCGSLLGLAPYGVLADSGIYAGNGFERQLVPSLPTGKVISALQIKCMERFQDLYSHPMRTLGDGLLVCFFFAALFYPFMRKEVRMYRWPIVAGLLFSMVLAALFGQSTDLLMHIFWPFVLLYGLVFFLLLLERMELSLPLFNTAVTSIFFFLCALPLVFALLPPRVGVPYPPYFPPYITYVSSMLTPDELMCTDMPWATAWYGGRNSLLIPGTVDEFYEINDYTKRISGLYITTITRDKRYVRDLIAGAEKSWFPILQGRIPSDFPLAQGIPLGDMDQIFLTDRPRWLEKK
ncbi:MAG: hypothetical protein EOL87_01360 [Spartobacteria bacterium]|nr:hypothetical protein [Spartobacteria bacterium]